MITIICTIVSFVIGYACGHYFERRETEEAITEIMHDKKTEVNAIGFVGEE